MQIRHKMFFIDMELDAKYNPSSVEEKWYSYWTDHKFFHSEPDAREPYTIVIPPPNVTGILHMGHVLNNTLNDVLIRKARMDGKMLGAGNGPCEHCHGIQGGGEAQRAGYFQGRPYP